MLLDFSIDILQIFPYTIIIYTNTLEFDTLLDRSVHKILNVYFLLNIFQESQLT